MVEHPVVDIWEDLDTLRFLQHGEYLPCCNLSLGFVTKAREVQKGSLGITFHAPGNVGECEGMNPTLPNELPLWELDFGWILKSSKRNCKGPNS